MSSSTLVFKYSAITTDRQIVHGRLQADSFERARVALLRQFAHLLVLKETRTLSLAALLGPRHDPAALSLYMRRLATMLSAGVSFIRAFEFVAAGEDERLNSVFRSVSQQMRTGKSVSRAMSEHSEVFGELTLAMVVTAERSGGLHHTFAKLAELMEDQVHTRRRILGALTYPAVIGCISLAVFSLFLFFVVPTLMPMFEQVGVELPGLTLAMVSLAGVLKNPALWAFLGLLFGIVVPAFYRYAYTQRQLPKFKYLIDDWALSLPVVSRVVELSVVSRTLHTLATLAETGIGIQDAIENSAQVAGNEVVKTRLLNSLRFLREGHGLAQCFRTWNVFPPMVLSMVELGERTGKLPYLLKKTSELLKEDLEHELTRLTTLVEPVMMMFTGLGVGLIVLASFLPLISLIQQL